MSSARFGRVVRRLRADVSSLRVRILVPVLALVFLAALAQILITDALSRRQTESLIQERATLVLDGIDQQIVAHERNKEVFARLIAEEPDIVKAVAQRDTVTLARLLVPLQIKLGLGDVSVMDADGQVLLQLGSNLAFDDAVPLVRSALLGQTESTSVIADTGLHVAASTPIKGPDGIAGVIVVGSILTGAVIQSVPSLDEVVVGLFQDGRFIGTSVKQVALVSMLQDASGPDAVMDLDALNQRLAGMHVRAIARPVGVDGQIIAVVPILDLTVAAQDRQRIVLLSTFTLEAVLVVLGLILARWISRPLEAMVDATRGIVRGNYRHRIPPSSIRELRGLGDAVNHLSEQMEVQLTGLTRAEAKYRTLVEQLPAITYLQRLEANFGLLYISPQVTATLGFTPDECLADPDHLMTILHPDDRDRVLFEHQRAAEWGVAFSIEYRVLTRKGDLVWLHDEAIIVCDDSGHPQHWQGILVDITRQKELEAQLTQMAFHDALTKLPNRVLFMDRLQNALDRARRTHRVPAVLFLDLDNFKQVNDSLGHEAGDALLVEVAKRLRSSVHADDTVARFGGDEFTILLENIDGEAMLGRVTTRIAEVLAAPIVMGRHEFIVRASIGGVTGISSSDSAEEVLRQADIAMYQAKRGGKAQLQVFDPAMNVVMITRLNLERHLRRAIERDELRLHYQPILRVASGMIVGIEALVRWEHPEYGMVGPDEFIPIAEETGLIVPIGEWVLREACRQLTAWNGENLDRPPLYVSVNLSARQFRQVNLAERVTAILAETGLAPALLALEITESTVMDDTACTHATLDALKRAGVRLMIDDFGIGYSSLAYLRRFPVDVLKIDRSFIRSLPEDVEQGVIVSAIMGLSHALGLEVVGEGVETAEQLSQLREYGCDLVQGYYLARPLPPARLAELIAADQPFVDARVLEEVRERAGRSM